MVSLSYIAFASRFEPTDGHNSLWIMSAPTTGCRGMGTVIGAALSIRGTRAVLILWSSRPRADEILLMNEIVISDLSSGANYLFF
jgi:hypothetical protein